jgi:DNA-binding LytR/AlgR family response regulator
MNIVIIEDEQLAAKNLIRCIQKVRPHFKVKTVLNSISSAVLYFQTNKTTDLIFCDVELIDGPSFNIFSQVEIKSPIIYITAFNNYAKEALQSNAIGYLTKPFGLEELEQSLVKFELQLQKEMAVNFVKNNNINIEQTMLVHLKEDILPVLLSEIALFCLEKSGIYLISFKGEKLDVNKSIQYLESLQPNIFFRANRQFLINRTAIGNIKRISNRRLHVKLNIPYRNEIYISKEKAAHFIKWVSNKK